jgi:hypothetical protein
MLMSSQTAKAPQILTELPGPNARKLVENDERYTSPSYTRFYPLGTVPKQNPYFQDLSIIA